MITSSGSEHFALSIMLSIDMTKLALGFLSFSGVSVCCINSTVFHRGLCTTSVLSFFPFVLSFVIFSRPR